MRLWKNFYPCLFLIFVVSILNCKTSPSIVKDSRGSASFRTETVEQNSGNYNLLHLNSQGRGDFFLVEECDQSGACVQTPTTDESLVLKNAASGSFQVSVRNCIYNGNFKTASCDPAVFTKTLEQGPLSSVVAQVNEGDRVLGESLDQKLYKLYALFGEHKDEVVACGPSPVLKDYLKPIEEILQQNPVAFKDEYKKQSFPQIDFAKALKIDNSGLGLVEISRVPTAEKTVRVEVRNFAPFRPTDGSLQSKIDYFMDYETGGHSSILFSEDSGSKLLYISWPYGDDQTDIRKYDNPEIEKTAFYISPEDFDNFHLWYRSQDFAFIESKLQNKFDTRVDITQELEKLVGANNPQKQKKLKRWLQARSQNSETPIPEDLEVPVEDRERFQDLLDQNDKLNLKIKAIQTDRTPLSVGEMEKLLASQKELVSELRKLLAIEGVMTSILENPNQFKVWEKLQISHRISELKKEYKKTDLEGSRRLEIEEEVRTKLKYDTSVDMTKILKGSPNFYWKSPLFTEMENLLVVFKKNKLALEKRGDRYAKTFDINGQKGGLSCVDVASISLSKLLEEPIYPRDLVIPRRPAALIPILNERIAARDPSVKAKSAHGGKTAVAMVLGAIAGGGIATAEVLRGEEPAAPLQLANSMDSKQAECFTRAMEHFADDYLPLFTDIETIRAVRESQYAAAAYQGR